MPEPGPLFILGPPAAGKSTIGRALATKLRLRFHTIDDWTPRGQSMTDEEVDVALRSLIEAVGCSRAIVEFCYHAYDKLIAANAFPIFSSAPKIVVTAPLRVCKARNRARQSPVREEYMDRAWYSAAWLEQHQLSSGRQQVLVINTDRHSVTAAIEAAVHFATAQGES